MRIPGELRRFPGQQFEHYRISPQLTRCAAPVILAQASAAPAATVLSSGRHAGENPDPEKPTGKKQICITVSTRF